jgi:hypothetical protein
MNCIVYSALNSTKIIARSFVGKSNLFKQTTDGTDRKVHTLMLIIRRTGELGWEEEEVMAYSKVLFHNFPQKTGENYAA